MYATTHNNNCISSFRMVNIEKKIRKVTLCSCWRTEREREQEWENDLRVSCCLMVAQRFSTFRIVTSSLATFALTNMTQISDNIQNERITAIIVHPNFETMHSHIHAYTNTNRHSILLYFTAKWKWDILWHHTYDQLSFRCCCVCVHERAYKRIKVCILTNFITRFSDPNFISPILLHVDFVCCDFDTKPRNGKRSHYAFQFIFSY